jgi:exodeoxyribonuclease V gamma subunit
VVAERVLARAGALVAAAGELRVGAHRPLAVDRTAGGVRLAGSVDDRWDPGVVRLQYARNRARGALGTWVRLLAAAVAGGDRRGWLVGRDGDRAEILALDLSGWPDGRAAQVLDGLLALYRAGLSRPLPLFPETSRAYAAAMRGGAGDPDAIRKALDAARRAWRTAHPDHPCEDADPYLAWLYRGDPPWQPGTALPGLDSPPALAFDALALAVWGPILEATP